MAAVLIPLLALTPSCAAPRQGVRLQFEDREVTFTAPAGGGTPIAIPEAELWGSFRMAARAVAVHPDPLAAAEQAFDVAEAGGTYRYYARSGRLVPESGLELAEDSAERLTREYLEWCGGTRLGGGDCLHLLQHTTGLSLHGRYVVTLVMSMTASFGPMLDSLKEFADPNAVAVMLASAVAMYLVLLLIPEPISKLISLTITGTLIGYLGLTAFWDLVYGWRALAKTVDEATEFSELRRAARDFGKVLGPQVGQLLILLVSHSLGKGIAARGATAPPRFAEASAQAERLLRVGPAGAATIQSVAVGAGVVTITLATSATMMTTASSTGDNGSSGPQRGIGGSGWRGDKAWRDAVRQVDRGGTIESIGGKVPTKQEALDLIAEAQGRVERIDLLPHEPPNPHQYPHINYITANGLKGTIRIQ